MERKRKKLRSREGKKLTTDNRQKRHGEIYRGKETERKELRDRDRGPKIQWRNRG